MGRPLACVVALHLSAFRGAAIGITARIAPEANGTKDCYSPYEGEPLLLVKRCDPSIRAGMTRAFSDGSCVCMGGGGELLNPGDNCCVTAPVICQADSAKRLQASFGKAVEVVHDNSAEYYRLASGKIERTGGAARSLISSDFYMKWRSLEDQEVRIQSLLQNCPSAAREEIGRSVENRPIWAVRFTGKNYKKGDMKLLLTFQLHAREWISGMSAVYVIEQIVGKLREEPDWLQQMQLMVMPMVNPDGFKYSATTNRLWRKNTAAIEGRCGGVDLNRNFPVQWQGGSSTSMSTCSEVYTGPSSASEPETKAVMKAVDEAKLFLHLDYHSFGEIILAPWGYTYDRHPQRKNMDLFMEQLRKDIQSHEGPHYQWGGNEISYPASGICPDYSTEKGAWGFTIELSPRDQYFSGGFLLKESKIAHAVLDAWSSTLTAVEWLKANGTAIA